MIGSGGMARSHVESFLLEWKIKKIQVYNPTHENREAYAKETGEKYGAEAVPRSKPSDVYKGTQIARNFSPACCIEEPPLL